MLVEATKDFAKATTVCTGATMMYAEATKVNAAAMALPVALIICRIEATMPVAAAARQPNLLLTRYNNIAVLIINGRTSRTHVKYSVTQPSRAIARFSDKPFRIKADLSNTRILRPRPMQGMSWIARLRNSNTRDKHLRTTLQ